MACTLLWMANMIRSAMIGSGSAFGAAWSHLKLSVALAVAVMPTGLQTIMTTCLLQGQCLLLFGGWDGATRAPPRVGVDGSSSREATV